MGLYNILLVVHTIIVIFLILLVLIQRSDSDGMGGLGGGGGNQFMTGRGQANFLTRTTAILAAAFMANSLILAVMASRMTETSIVDKHIEAPAPVTSEAPTEKPVPAAPSVPKPE